MRTSIKHGAYRAFAKLGLEIRPYAPIERWRLRITRKNVRTLLLFNRMLQLVSDKKGIVVECGLGKMRTAQLLALLLQEEGRDRAFWGFDSFEGHPQPTAHDVNLQNPRKSARRGDWKLMSADDARQMLANLPVTIPVNIVEGFFEQTIPAAEVPPIAFLHLDCVLYDSYRTCLEHLFPKVVEGGVVLLDEYDEFDRFPGGRKAIDEYVARKNYAVEQDPQSGKWFVIKAR